MCGIVGYTGTSTDAVVRAHALQAHRGPDDSGFFSDDFVSLGHNRLAIIDLDHRSAQPMWDTSKRYCVVFNGEIYNFKALRLELARTYQFQTESDTEVLLALFIRYGEDLCTHVRGMYAFAIYDSLHHELFLFRDPFGIKPLYYAYREGSLYFASELKAIVSLFGSRHLPLELDHESIAVYLTLGYTISPRTIYRSIQMLEPGTRVRFNIKSGAQPAHSIIPLPASTPMTQATYEDLVCERVLSNLVADVPVGVFFSGGTDSSLITAILHEHGQDLETFSVKVAGRDTDSYYFDAISKKLALKSNVYTFDTNAFDSVYPTVVSKLDNPSGSDSIFQSYFIAEKAREKVKVVLLGDGGDELFYGYSRSFPLARLDDKNIAGGQWLERLYFLVPSVYGKNYAFLKLFSWFGYPLGYYLNAMSHLRDKGSYSAWQICRQQILARSVSPAQFDRKLYLQDGLLFKNDAATSYCSLEGRVPFLDPDILVNALPFVQKSIETNTHKFLTKHMLAKYLPKELVYRKKSGFGVSYAQILKESKHLQHDYLRAHKHLTRLGIPLERDPAFYIRKYPHFLLVVTTLWHSIVNNQRVYEEGSASTPTENFLA